ncbi:MAG TPA: mercuric transporter MerT family protein [Thermoanaerobaculia bacterium]
MDRAGNARLLSAGAVASAIAASICCFGPLVLALAGLGGGALLLKLEPLRPYSLAAAAMFLGGAFYLAYRRGTREECAPDSACAHASNRRGQRIALWIVAAVVVLAAAFPYLSKWLF